MRKFWTIGALAALCAALTAPLASPAAAQGKKLILGVPGIPPIFVSVIALVGDQQGFFRKYGVDVQVKPLESGTAAARALISGDLDLALSPSPLIVNQISNADADAVGIYGFPRPDFLIASTDPTKATCKDMIGQAVGVDAIGGARAVALRQMLMPCGVKLDDVQQIALPSTATTAAMIAGRITFGVLHIDEIPVLEAQGKPVTVITTIDQANPNSHFAMVVVRRASLKDNRDAFVRVTAALIEAARFIKDARNVERVAEIAEATGRTRAEATGAVKRFNEIDYWPTDDDGLDRRRLEAVIATQVKLGGIRPGKEPVTYDRLVDQSIWKDAAALVAKR